MKENIQGIIDGLSDIQIKILLRFAKLGASRNCNVRLETIQKRLLKHERNHTATVIQELIAKSLVFPYRSKNYGLTKTGIIVAHRLLDIENEEVYGFKIE